MGGGSSADTEPMALTSWLEQKLLPRVLRVHDTVYRSKRGAEKTLFQLTIILFALFIIISIVAVSLG